MPEPTGTAAITTPKYTYSSDRLRNILAENLAACDFSSRLSKRFRGTFLDINGSIKELWDPRKWYDHYDDPKTKDRRLRRNMEKQFSGGAIGISPTKIVTNDAEIKLSVDDLTPAFLAASTSLPDLKKLEEKSDCVLCSQIEKRDNESSPESPPSPEDSNQLNRSRSESDLLSPPKQNGELPVNKMQMFDIHTFCKQVNAAVEKRKAENRQFGMRVRSLSGEPTSYSRPQRQQQFRRPPLLPNPDVDDSYVKYQQLSDFIKRKFCPTDKDQCELLLALFRYKDYNLYNNTMHNLARELYKEGLISAIDRSDELYELVKNLLFTDTMQRSCNAEVSPELPRPCSAPPPRTQFPYPPRQPFRRTAFPRGQAHSAIRPNQSVFRNPTTVAPSNRGHKLDCVTHAPSGGLTVPVPPQALLPPPVPPPEKNVEDYMKKISRKDYDFSVIASNLEQEFERKPRALSANSALHAAASVVSPNVPPPPANTPSSTCISGIHPGHQRLAPNLVETPRTHAHSSIAVQTELGDLNDQEQLRSSHSPVFVPTQVIRNQSIMRKNVPPTEAECPINEIVEPSSNDPLLEGNNNGGQSCIHDDHAETAMEQTELEHSEKGTSNKDVQASENQEDIRAAQMTSVPEPWTSHGVPSAVHHPGAKRGGSSAAMHRNLSEHSQQTGSPYRQAANLAKRKQPLVALPQNFQQRQFIQQHGGNVLNTLIHHYHAMASHQREYWALYYQSTQMAQYFTSLAASGACPQQPAGRAPGRPDNVTNVRKKTGSLSEVPNTAGSNVGRRQDRASSECD